MTSFFTNSEFKSTGFGHIFTSLYNNNPIAAIPIQIEKEHWKIRKIDQTLPQIFKDFPLIGSPSIKWNAIINSDQFYPDQQRSHLLLKGSDQSILPRIQTNRQFLIHCFEGIKEIYLYLAQNSSQGLQNLLIMNPNNQFLIGNNKLNQNLVKSIDEILDTKFIPAIKENQQTKCRPKDLCFIQSINKNIDSSQRIILSYELAQQFKFLYSDKFLLNSKYYGEFLDVVDKQNDSSYKVLKINQYITLEKCLSDLAQLTYPQFQKLFGQNSFSKLHQIYGLITRYKLPIWNYKIFLNEENKFVRFQKGQMMKNKATEFEQQLLQTLNIEFKQKIINTAFVNYFTEQLGKNQFTKSKVQKLICQHFSEIDGSDFKNNYQYYINNIQELFKLLITYEYIPQVTEKILKRIEIFKELKPFDLSVQISQNQKFTPIVRQRLKKNFIHNFSLYFQYLIGSTNSFESFSNQLLNMSTTNSIKFLKVLFNDSMIGQKLSEIPYKLNIYLTFTKQNSLRKLSQGVQLPNQQDKQIYFLFDGNINQSLMKKIVLDIYPYESLKNITKITYQQLFKIRIHTKYNGLQLQKQRKILEYASRIEENFEKTTYVDKTVAQKYHAWKQFIIKKHERIYQIQKANPIYQKRVVIDFLYQIQSDTKKLQTQAENYFKRKGNSLFQNEKQTPGNPNKKVKKD